VLRYSNSGDNLLLRRRVRIAHRVKRIAPLRRVTRAAVKKPRPSLTLWGPETKITNTVLIPAKRDCDCAIASANAEGGA